ncbi:TraR/DksA family transcriptional regulator [Aquincola sp. MAHUQ-54]|uniref:TraR/DksA family transcriptional regulator n=1 Tax=Aquincola agrisoli TaxID=3119538 RepID=A0AAW9Q805_9BURK
MDLPTQNHLTQLRDLLSYRLRALRSEIDAAGQRRMEMPDGGPRDVRDRKEDAAEAMSSGIEAAEVERDVEEMAQVEAALRRLDEGVYGDCLDCGEPIPLQRLFVQPAAERCAACQAAKERLALHDR